MHPTIFHRITGTLILLVLMCLTLVSQPVSANDFAAADSITTDSITTDWTTAEWITADCASGMPIFRKTFQLSQPRDNVDSATAFVCGLGHYQLDVNGQTVSDPLAPGWTNYRKTCLYNRCDFTAALNPVGIQVLGLWLGNGMYNVPGGRYIKFTGSFGQPQLIFKAVIRFKDGSEQIIVSDESWKTTVGPIRFSCVYGGEDWLLTPALNGWNTSSFDDSPWTQAQKSTAVPTGTLRPQTHPAIAVVDTLKPEKITIMTNGIIEADFGYNFSGRPKLLVKGHPGSSVKITLAERKGLPWNGHSYTFTFDKAYSSDTPAVLLLPHFTYWGFQFMYIEGAVTADNPTAENQRTTDNPTTETSSGKPAIEAIAAEFLSSSAQRVGQFSSTAPWLNEIEAMIDRSVRSNLQHVITDCPHREKLGWLEVPHLMGPSILYRFDAQLLYRKICSDITESQLPSGMVPDISPEYTRFSHGFFESAEWSSSTVQIPWLLYKFYGDTDTMTAQYETMDRYMTYFASTRNSAGLAKAGLGDWYDWSPQRGHAGYSQHTPGELTATAFLIDNARIMARISTILNHPDKAHHYTELAEQATADFLRAYYNPETGIVARDSQAGYAFALAFDIIPEKERPKVVENLVKAIELMDYRPTTGEVSFVFLLRTLMRENRGDILAKIIMRTSSPGYVNMLVNHGMKTLSETWDGPGSSMNHCMFGHAQEWFTAGLLGIRQTENSTAFRELLLWPEPSDEIRNAEGHFDSRQGRIESRWNIADGKFHWQFTIPENTTALASVPVRNETSPVTFTDGQNRSSTWQPSRKSSQETDQRSDQKASQESDQESRQGSGRRVYKLTTGSYEISTDWGTP